jgi:hypothetical protein
MLYLKSEEDRLTDMEIRVRQIDAIKLKLDTINSSVS